MRARCFLSFQFVFLLLDHYARQPLWQGLHNVRFEKETGLSRGNAGFAPAKEVTTML